MLPRFLAFFFGLGFLRFIFKAVVFVIVLCAIGLVLFALFFDLNKYKPRIESYLSRQMNADVRVEGDIGIGADWGRPSLVFKKLSVDRSADPQNAWRSERVEVVVPIQVPSDQNPLHLVVDIDDVSVAQKTIGHFRIDVKVDGSGVFLPDISGQVYDGDVQARLSFQDRQLNLKGMVEDAQYRHFMQGIEGKADINFDLKSMGASGDALLRNLSGQFSLIGGEGELAGNAVNLWAADLLTSFLQGENNQTTKLNCIVADFDVRQGVAYARTLLMDTEKVTVTGKGAIYLAEGRVDLFLEPKPKNPSLISMATPVTVKGAFDRIQVRPDTKSVLQKLGGLALNTIVPGAALVPLMHKGSDKNPCIKILKNNQEATQ